jgi:hypothetical protein
MMRVDGVTEREAGPFGHFVYGPSRRRFGEAAEPVAMTAHRARLLLGYGA